MRKNIDRIGYILVSEAGGVDGLDNNDKGGKEIAAFYTEQEALGSQKYPHAKLEKRVLEIEKIREEALKKLTPTEILVLNIGVDLTMPRC